MDFIKAVDIIKKDLDEAGALLEQLAEAPGIHVAEIELARSRVHSAKEMLRLLPVLNTAMSTEGQKTLKEKDEQEVNEMKQQETAKTILADRLGSASGTIAEKISTEKHDEVITTVLHSKPIKDIASAIGINDRFYYIRELFSGDSLAYQDTVMRLDSASSLGEAMKILDESTVMGSDPAAQSSFVDVVRRKFSINV